MKSCWVIEVNEHEFDMRNELFKKEIEDKVEIAEIFGRMKEQVLIATNLIELGILEHDIIAEVTGLSLSHIEAISGIN